MAARQSNLDIPVQPTVDGVGGISQVQIDGTPPYGEPVLYVDQIQAIYRDSIMIDPTTEEEIIHRWIHDAFPNTAPDSPITGKYQVGPDNPGIPNLGPPNRQLGQSGHSQNIVPNPSAEQGWGLDPAILIPRFPRSVGDNRYYARLSGYRRNGSMDIVVAPPGVDFVTQGKRQAIFGPTRFRSQTHKRLVDIPASVPYSANQPIGPTVFINTLPDGVEAIYG